MGAMPTLAKESEIVIPRNLRYPPELVGFCDSETEGGHPQSARETPISIKSVRVGSMRSARARGGAHWD